MNLNQTVYFMSLVGGVAGLCSWVLTTLLSDMTFAAGSPLLVQALNTTILGALLGAFTVGFADRWTADRLVARWLVTGTLLGAAAGLLTGFAAVPIQRLLLAQPALTLSALPRIAIWVIAGGLIGLVTGLRWVSVNPFRAVHAMIGGLAGGALGGVVYATLASIDDFFAALAYVLLGMGITLGVTLAPVLLREGILQFISSGDARAQNKYASPRQEWVIQKGDRFVIGSQGADMSMSMYSRDVQIYIPDAMVAPRHALLYEQRKRFFIQQHPDNVGPQGQPEAPLQLGRMNVVGTRELRDGDELIVGQTLLTFRTKKKRSEHTPAEERWAH